MKVTPLLIFSVLLFTGCFSSQNAIDEQDVRVLTATYTPWSYPPPNGSDIPERGTDLRIVVQNWPSGYIPEYIVFNNRISSPADLASDEQGRQRAVITARIIQMSDLIQQRSEATNLSDRLVFRTANGETGFIVINHWQSQ